MKLNHLIAATALAALASGTALAQNGGTSAGASATPSASGILNGAKDKVQDEKGNSGLSSGNSSTKKDVKGTSTNPITVTPPSQDDPNLRANVDTDPARANAAAGQSGASADAQLNAPQTTNSKLGKGKANVKPITDKLKKSDDNNSDHK